MGVTTALFPAMTLGSGVTGQGITSENVSPLNLVYIRTVGAGIRDSAYIRRYCGDQLAEIKEKRKMEREEGLRLIRRLIGEAVSSAS